MDGSPDQIARRRRALRRWLFAYPLATLAFSLCFFLWADRLDLGGFFLALLAAGVVALAIPFVALIDGARAGAIGPALSGCLLGILPALLVLLLVDQAVRAYQGGGYEAQRKRFAALTQASERGDGDAIRAAMAKLPAEYGPGRALCIVGGEGLGTGSGDDWLMPDPDGIRPRVSTARLFDAAQALMRERPRAQQQTLLSALLVRLSERNEIDHLPRWLRLWRTTQADPGARLLLFDEPRDPDAMSDCRLEGNVDLARVVASSWHDAGLRAWIRAGYGFAPEQELAALEGVRTKAGFDELIAAGLDPAARLRRLGPDEAPLSRLTGRLSLWLDDSEDPAAQADLVDAYVGAGADIARAAYGRTPCQEFTESEAEREGARSQAASPARQAAARRIRQALCPQGQPPPAVSSSTTPYEDSVSAAAEAAAAAGRAHADADAVREHPPAQR
ncbi:hypothetical protein [Lysobacter sp. CA199]|uniref:hypothetical protein n=1 Tax=Lysobacter sp. CA199 TaxID=3455608 RepID=UPI003F8D6229